MKPTQSDALRAYREKRSLDRTPEPGGAVAPVSGSLFVVHKHAATRTHYDLRLEMEGVLRSWAVPKGPSRDPAEKRLAVHVEDHPVEYGDFEGVIPEGNYGAGAVIVWDRGQWVPIGDPAEGLEKGKLLFELKGYKLRGRWTLVKIKKSEKDWLLIKERDGWVKEGPDEFPEESVLSGLTVEEVEEGRSRAGEVREELEALGAKRRVVRARDVEVMLAETREKPFTRAGWLFELKYDGYRMVAAKEDGAGVLITRNGNDATATFPEIARALAALPYSRIVLDGEIVVADETGRPSFQRLQQRGRLTRALEVRKAAVELPATLYAFDLLGFEEHDLRALPLATRKELLRRVLPRTGPLRYSDHIEERGEAFFEQVEKLGLEGMVAKKADSAYRGGRSANWIKVRAERTGDFVVIGYTAPQGTRTGFGALHLGAYDDGRLVYTGRVGTGFTAKQLREIHAQLEALRRPDPPAKGVPKGREHTWVEPELVAEIRYTEWTDDGLLRQPVFLRFRDDKPPAECVKPGGPAAGLDEPAAATAASPVQRPRAEFTNLDKVFWPQEGYTKGDLIEYYRAVAPWLLPYLKDRPLVMTRYPDGIEGKSFFQKDAPEYARDFVRTARIWSEDSKRELNYFIADDVDALLYIINLGTIALHIWGSRVQTAERPDWCILDLDPKGAPFTHVVEVARALHELCEAIGLPNFVKTSGSSGLHVLVPVARLLTHEQTRMLGQLLGRVVVAELPEIATLTRQVRDREGKVYIDYVQNGHGRLLVAPFSVRPLPGAPVSAPLEWSEVNDELDLRDHTIRTVPERLQERKQDPLAPVLTTVPDLAGALERLQERL
ncbi:MAG TPA: DNA ligase D [Longimicrobiales bacterium]